MMQRGWQKVRLGAIALVLSAACGAAFEGPAPVIWDKDVCSNCRMHLGEPAFAAQLHTSDGEVHHFDDPGCLFLYLERERLTVREAWFRHAYQDRWLARSAVAFAPHGNTPMGFGLAAVDAGTQGAIDFAAAHAAVNSSETAVRATAKDQAR